MYKLMQGVDKIVAVELFSRADSVWTTGHRLRVKMRVRTVLRQGSFSWRVVNAWNGLPGKVVEAEVGRECIHLNGILKGTWMHWR